MSIQHKQMDQSELSVPVLIKTKHTVVLITDKVSACCGVLTR